MVTTGYAIMNGTAALVTPRPVSPEVSPMLPHSTCSIDGCERSPSTRGWCGMHYHRWQRHGDPSVVARFRSAPLEQRFWERVRKSDGCWLWTGRHRPDGYGQLLTAERRVVYAHRLAYEIHHGPIPDGMFVCHHCDNTPCVRPDHLFLGTHADNMRDMREKGRAANGNTRKTQCKRGHPFDNENAYVPRAGNRSCRRCRRDRERSRRAVRPRRR